MAATRGIVIDALMGRSEQLRPIAFSELNGVAAVAEHQSSYGAVSKSRGSARTAAANRQMLSIETLRSARSTEPT